MVFGNGKTLREDGIMKFIKKMSFKFNLEKIKDLSLRRFKSFGHTIIPLKPSLVAQGLYILILGGIY